MWPERNVDGDSRSFLGFWGTETDVGGCCHYTKNDGSGWGKKFTMYYSGPAITITTTTDFCKEHECLAHYPLSTDASDVSGNGMDGENHEVGSKCDNHNSTKKEFSSRHRQLFFHTKQLLLCVTLLRTQASCCRRTKCNVRAVDVG